MAEQKDPVPARTRGYDVAPARSGSQGGMPTQGKFKHPPKKKAEEAKKDPAPKKKASKKTSKSKND